MEISCGALGDVDRLREDDLFKTVSFYDAVSWAWDGGDSSNALFNDLLSFGEEINALAASLPEDPFSMNIRSTLNSLGEEAATLPNDPFCMTLKDHKVSVLDDGGGEEPHSAFDLVLPYLEMRDAFAVESVCRSLRDSVRKESCLWRTVDLSDDSLLKYRVTDDSLLKLTRRAQGRLRCLNLGGCVSITDDGLMQVLASNPRLSKVSFFFFFFLKTMYQASVFNMLFAAECVRLS